MAAPSAKQLSAALSPRLAGLLAPHGFTQAGATRCEFHRRLETGVWHVIAVHKHHRTASKFIVYAFPTSPVVDERLRSDDPHFSVLATIANALDPLNPSKTDPPGLSSNPKAYRCDTIDGALEIVDRQVAPLLEQKVLPFLGSVRTLDDLLALMLPAHLGSPLLVGIVYAALGLTQEAEAAVLPLVERWEQHWASPIDHPDTADVLGKLRSASPRLADRLEQAIARR